MAVCILQLSHSLQPEVIDLTFVHFQNTHPDLLPALKDKDLSQCLNDIAMFTTVTIQNIQDQHSNYNTIKSLRSTGHLSAGCLWGPKDPSGLLQEQT